MTATELALALMLFTVLFGAAFKAAAAAERATARNVAYRLTAYLREVRQEAIARGATCAMRVSTDRVAADCGGIRIRPDEAVGPAVRLQPDGGRLEYSARGLSASSQDQWVQVEPRSGGIRWRVTVTGETGAIAITREP